MNEDGRDDTAVGCAGDPPWGRGPDGLVAYHERLLPAVEQEHGPDHPDTWRARSSLGALGTDSPFVEIFRASLERARERARHAPPAG